MFNFIRLIDIICIVLTTGLGICYTDIHTTTTTHMSNLAHAPGVKTAAVASHLASLGLI